MSYVADYDENEVTSVYEENERREQEKRQRIRNLEEELNEVQERYASQDLEFTANTERLRNKIAQHRRRSATIKSRNLCITKKICARETQYFTIKARIKRELNSVRKMKQLMAFKCQGRALDLARVSLLNEERKIASDLQDLETEVSETSEP